MSPGLRRAVPVLAALAAAGAALLAARAGTAAAADGTLRWSDCGRGAQCATLRVPLRYDRPAGRSLSIATMRVPARDRDRRLGALVVNFGGPGSSGRDYLVDFAGELPDELRERFDVVLYDPRGVGRSEGMRCTLDVAALLDLDDRVSTLSPAQLSARSWEVVRPCARRNAATLRWLGTTNAARDLDRLRAALGEARLTYLGYSYGTRLGSVYAELFPGRVRALVLDGAVTPSSDWRKLSLDSAAAAEAAFARFFAACRTGCASEHVSTLWRAAVRRLRDEPIRVGGHRIGPAYLEFVASLSFGAGRGALRELGDLVERVAREDDAGRRRDIGRELSDALEQTIGAGQEVAARLAIDCADDPGRPSDAAIRSFDRLLRTRYPIAGPTSNESCPRQWPAAVEPLPRVRAAGAPTILVVGTTDDPVTPYRWSRELAAALRTSVLVTAVGDTHTSFALGGRCLDTLVTRYLVTLARPSVTRCG